MLILGYLKETGKLTPSVSMKLEQAISLGYQRLLTFEVKGGGFDWYGHAPANVALTAYGILEFSDMAKVHAVDPGVIQRAANWLRSQQRGDGSWTESRLPHSLNAGRGDLAVTAFVVWSLAQAGHRDPSVQRGVQYLQTRLKSADDPYTLSLCANALAAWSPRDAQTRSLVERIDKMAARNGEQVSWQQRGHTLTYGAGRAGEVETTALAALSLLAGQGPMQSVNGALGYLVSAKDPYGGWHSTQATIMAMKALLGHSGAPVTDRCRVAVRVNGEPAGELEVDRANADVMQLLDLRRFAREGSNRIELEVEGGAAMTYQVVGRWFLPWDQLPADADRKPLELFVHYDRTTLEKDDILECTVQVHYHDPTPTFMVIADVGIPPGFTVDPGSLNELVRQRKIDKYSVTGRQVQIYLGDVRSDMPIAIRYSLRAKYPIRAKTPVSTVYEYYNPDRRAAAAPIEIEVR